MGASRSILLAGLLFAAPAFATNYFVDKNAANASDGNAGTSCSPWLTIGKAAQTMVAGDTVFVKAGTYLQTRTGTDRFTPALNPAHSGFRTGPIVFKTFMRDSVIIKYDPSETDKGPLIGANLQDWITWDGFIVQETQANYAADTGPVTGVGSQGTRARGIKLQNLDIRCVELDYDSNGKVIGTLENCDNHNGIRLEDCDSCDVVNTKIAGIGTEKINGVRAGFGATACDAPHNKSGVTTYSWRYGVIKNCEVFNCYTGIYVKGTDGYHPVNHSTETPNQFNEVCLNLIHDCAVGIRTSFTKDTKIDRNIVRAQATGLEADPDSRPGYEEGETCAGNIETTDCSGGNKTANVDVYNNVFYDHYKGIRMAENQGKLVGGGRDIRNNIVYSTFYPLVSGPVQNGEDLMASVWNSNYNCYYTFDHFRAYPGGTGTDYFTVSSWKSQTAASGVPKDSSYVDMDPSFTNASGGDFHLNGGPASGAGVDSWDIDGDLNTTEAIDMGAYPFGTETIGYTPTYTTFTSAVPDPLQSYFVPQSGSLTSPTEGAAAIANARRCPNDDGINILRMNARLKIVAKATNGSPIAGIPAADVFVLFNTGTQVQGFCGAGDDTIIANYQYNPLANCPNVFFVPADGPTDASGVTYITWLGATKDGSGNAIRDPVRKWGAYAGSVPVMVLGIPLQGKLTSTSPLGSYTAHVKSLDFVGGNMTVLNQGEVVNTADINKVQADAVPGKPYIYSEDFDNTGAVNSVDLNFIKAHNDHKCNFPNTN